MQELQSINFQAIQPTGKSITCKEKNTIEKGSCKNTLFELQKRHSAYMFLIRSYMHWPIVITKGGTYQQSIELYNTFIKEDSSEIKLNTIAKCYDKLEKPDSALIYRKIIAMQDIENQNNTIALAQNFLSMEQPDSALTYLCRYTSIDSTDLNINRLKAYAYNQAGLHQDAIKLYQKIRQSGDRQASTEYYLGLSYAYTDSLSQAYDCLVRANNLSERKNAYIYLNWV